MDQRETATPLIYSRIAAIMAEVPAIGKNQRNQEQKYQFRGIDDVYNQLHEIFVRNQVFTTSEILEFTRNDWTNKNQTLMIEYALKVRFRFNALDGSCIETETMGQAMDSSDKASNKAMSMAHKTALLQLLMVPTHGDNDADATTCDTTGYTRYQNTEQHQPQYQTTQPPNMQPARPQAPQQATPRVPAAPRTQEHQNRGYSGDRPASYAAPKAAQIPQGQRSQQPNSRPASPKQLEYLRDLAARPGISDDDARGIADYAAQGITGDQCSQMIDTINLYLGGGCESIFQLAEAQASQSSAAAYMVDEMPF
ncbi:MAG: ERF family protein [Chlorobiaceae bacterium]